MSDVSDVKIRIRTNGVKMEDSAESFTIESDYIHVGKLGYSLMSEGLMNGANEYNVEMTNAYLEFRATITGVYTSSSAAVTIKFK